MNKRKLAWQQVWLDNTALWVWKRSRWRLAQEMEEGSELALHASGVSSRLAHTQSNGCHKIQNIYYADLIAQTNYRTCGVQEICWR